ncbi:MAG: hypothetical protein CNIPEHKO_03066 [Anaerolineales bacterium]|nr:hypothetical protein [Anaerolineales bacterium]
MNEMNDQMPTEPKKNNTTTIIIIVAVVLLCCCCSMLAMFFGYDYLGDPLGIYGALPALTALF